MKEFRKWKINKNKSREAELVSRNSRSIVIEHMPDVDVEIIDDVEDPPIHRLVKIPHTQHGRYITKCQQCNRETLRNTNAAEVCNSCPRKPVLCDQRWKSECFDKWHKNDGYEFVPNLRGGQGLIPQALVGRELGHICHDVSGCKWKICICKKSVLGQKRSISKLPCFNVLSKRLQIVSVALDHRRNPSSSSSDEE